MGAYLWFPLQEGFQGSDGPLESPSVPTFLTKSGPSIELQLPGKMTATEMETRRWYHWVRPRTLLLAVAGLANFK